MGWPVLLVLLIVIALVLFLIETVTPHGVMGILGGVLMVGAVALTFVQAGPLEAMAVLVFAIVISVATILIGFKVMPNSPFGRALILSDSQLKGSGYISTEDTELQNLVGQEGVTTSYLRPAGVAKFGRQRVDVITEGGYLPAGTRVKCVAVQANRVVVRPV